MKWMHFDMASQLLLLMLLFVSVRARPGTPADPAPPATASPTPTVATVLANDTAIANQFIDNLNLTDISAVSMTNRRYVLRTLPLSDSTNHWDRPETNMTATTQTTNRLLADYDRSSNHILNEFLKASIDDLHRNRFTNVVPDPATQAVEKQTKDIDVEGSQEQREHHSTGDSYDTFYESTRQPSESSSFPKRFYEYEHESRPTDKLFFEQHYHIDQVPTPTSVIEVHHHHDVTSRPQLSSYQYSQHHHFDVADDQEQQDDADETNDNDGNVHIVYLPTTKRPRTSAIYVNNKLTKVKRKHPQATTRPEYSTQRPGSTGGNSADGTKNAPGCAGGCNVGPGFHPTSPDFAQYPSPNFPPLAPNIPPVNFPNVPSGPSQFPPQFPYQPPIPPQPPVCAPGYYFNPVVQRCESATFDNGPPPIIPGQFTGPGLTIHDKHQHNDHKHPVSTGNAQFVPTLVFQQLPVTTVAPPTRPHRPHAQQTHQSHDHPTKTKKKKRRRRRPKRPKRPKRKRRPSSSMLQMLNIKHWKVLKLLPLVALINPLTFGFWSLVLSPLLITMAIGSVLALLLYPWAGASLGRTSERFQASNIAPIVIHKHHHPARPRWRPPPPAPVPKRSWIAASSKSGPAIVVTPPSVRWTARRPKFPLTDGHYGERNRRDIAVQLSQTDLDNNSGIMWRNLTNFEDSFRRKYL